MKKKGDAFRLALKFNYKNKFIDPKLMESLKIKNLDKKDMFAQIEQKKLYDTDAIAMELIFLEKGAIEVDAERYFKIVF